MPRYIVKIKDLYCEWSTICDAPTTTLDTLEALKIWYREEFGRNGMEGLPARLERVEKQGTSARFALTPEDLMVCNRAGENETKLTLDEIYEKYREKKLDSEGRE